MLSENKAEQQKANKETEQTHTKQNKTKQNTSGAALPMKKMLCEAMASLRLSFKIVLFLS